MEWDQKSSLEWNWDNIELLAANPSEIGNGSTRSSFKSSERSFDAFHAWSKKLTNNGGSAMSEEIESSSSLAAAGIGEPLIGLKLGKRTYFEDVCGSAGAKDSPMSSSSSPAAPAVPSVFPVKKKKRVSQQDLQNARCQVEGCNVDLAAAKDYHRKHRVCELHTKSPKVVVAGLERRFCQQCSRFHGLSEFDQKKRSCRRRLSDHNARRRKPPPETFSTFGFDFRPPAEHFYGQGPYFQVWNSKNSSESFTGYNFAETKLSFLKPARAPAADHLPHESLISFAPPSFNQDAGAAAVASSSNGAPDVRRALSLLSIGSWGPPELQPPPQIPFPHVAAPVAVSPSSGLGSWPTTDTPFAQPPYGLSLEYFGGGNMQDSQLPREADDGSFDYGQLPCQ